MLRVFSSKKKFLVSLFMVSILMFMNFGNIAWAQNKRVVSFGANLSEPQRKQVAELVGLSYPLPADVQAINITNAQERQYLKGLVPENIIGTKAISSALVEVTEPGTGIIAFSKNITWVTNQMFISALATAGVKDARVTAVAPFNVSGTAALTGIINAFEKASGQNISEQNKKVANQELVQMGELGEAINDKEKAAQLISMIKEQVIQQGIKDPAQIQQIIVNVAGDLNVNLTDRQISDITKLMEQISKLDINIADLKGQVESLRQQWGDLLGKNEQVQGILQQILAAINNFFERIMAALGLA